VSARAGDEVDQLALQAVRVLELVDHDRTETELLPLADRFVVAQQVPGAQLEIFEVERRLAILPLLIRSGKAGEELPEPGAVRGGELVQRSLLDPLAGFLI